MDVNLLLRKKPKEIVENKLEYMYTVCIYVLHICSHFCSMFILSIMFFDNFDFFILNFLLRQIHKYLLYL